MLIHNLLFSTINYIKLWMNLKKKKKPLQYYQVKKFPKK